jgi:hypothetical protein
LCVRSIQGVLTGQTAAYRKESCRCLYCVFRAPLQQQVLLRKKAIYLKTTINKAAQVEPKFKTTADQFSKN